MAKQIRPVVWSWAIHWSVLSSTVACQANVKFYWSRPLCPESHGSTNADNYLIFCHHPPFRNCSCNYSNYYICPSLISQCCPTSAQLTEARIQILKNNFFLIFNTENAGSDPWPYPNRPTDGPEPSPTLHQHPRHYVECIVWVMETESMSESPEIIVCLKLNRTVLRKSVFSDYEHLILHQLFVMYMCFDWRMSMISCLCTTR